ncbi:metalloregulator ArsR/SmtB family transcription factor [Lactobacillus helveticus]|uniref:metalloregulator ArsR/SmtB family transcription factor n=1 Tax=Lactobacillus helveticus TaxID=1587 RepID=UPI001C64C7C3|nr:metalloregulator ArsR/SmtB family transcription factor [Lactobacillus helveticus]MBW8009014.1 metalloregulator ArsR/SmtB family transcription factor [Lactobacillus helveticus]MBW8014533.1 metalloregulator ArsR/SmtB family transcription factor [Lactobacillus helveticus]MBW8018325.1 metalloregulator ArsR/SmtB family transcription factor [Lactobacillus helveticus]MBW8043781.1 metalloregulator ArsR/SmtB family transcription factor [Lactobacillus helveticus]MBW8053246.1 metalloregulator ArsR/Smt
MQDNPAITYQNNAFDQVLRIGKAVSNLTRLKIIFILDQGPKSVEEIAKAINISVGTTSKNLQILKQANLVKEEKSKNFVFYALANEQVSQLLVLLTNLAEKSLPEMRNLEKSYDTLPQTEISDLKNQNMATTYILDLRPTDEFNNVHLPGAHNIPFNEIDFENLPFKPNQDVMVYCRGRLCGYADFVGKELKAKGYKHVSVFNHSVAEWQNEKAAK